MSGRRVMRSVLVVSVSCREIFTPRVELILTEFLFLAELFLFLTEPTDNTEFTPSELVVSHRFELASFVVFLDRKT